MVLHNFNIMHVECRDIFMQKDEHGPLALWNRCMDKEKENPQCWRIGGSLWERQVVKGIGLCASGDYLNTVAMLWKMTRTIGQEIEPVLLTKADADSGFLDTVQRTGIAV